MRFYDGLINATLLSGTFYLGLYLLIRALM